MSYTFFNIPSSASIGDSLTSVNINYANLEAWATSIQLSANNFWIPLQNLYNNISTQIKTSCVSAVYLQPILNNFVTTVNTNSAAWIKPLIVFYPKVITPDYFNAGTTTLANSAYKVLTNWFNNTYPVLSGDDVFYTQDQAAYLYISNRVINTTNSVQQVNATTTCSSQAGTACVYCTNNYTGVAICNQGNFNCTGSTSCTQCASVPCIYPQTGKSYYISTASAFLATNYQNQYEAPKIICLKYNIKNCQWNYISQI